MTHLALIKQLRDFFLFRKSKQNRIFHFFIRCIFYIVSFQNYRRGYRIYSTLLNICFLNDVKEKHEESQRSQSIQS